MSGSHNVSPKINEELVSEITLKHIIMIKCVL